LRQFLITFLLFLLGLPDFALAKTDISVSRFADRTEKGRCPALTTKAKADLDKALQDKLIAGLLQLKRFQIQEREVRQIKPQHSIVGTVRAFEVCALEGRGQKAQIALEVQVMNAKTGLTHMFSSSAQTSSAAADRALQMAMNAAISEIIKRVDDAVPRREGAIRLTNKRKLSSANPMLVRLVPRDRR